MPSASPSPSLIELSAPRQALVFLACFLLCLAGLGIGYALLARTSLGPVAVPVFVSMPVYWHTHPLPYLALVAALYALPATLWISRPRPIRYPQVFLEAAGAILAVLVAAGFWGGVLWTYHDMQAGFFPPYPRRWFQFLEGGLTGLSWIFPTALYSAPMTLLALGLGTGLTLRVKQVVLRTWQNPEWNGNRNAGEQQPAL